MKFRYWPKFSEQVKKNLEHGELRKKVSFDLFKKTKARFFLLRV